MAWNCHHHHHRCCGCHTATIRNWAWGGYDTANIWYTTKPELPCPVRPPHNNKIEATVARIGTPINQDTILPSCGIIPLLLLLILIPLLLLLILLPWHKIQWRPSSLSFLLPIPNFDTNSDANADADNDSHLSIRIIFNNIVFYSFLTPPPRTNRALYLSLSLSLYFSVSFYISISISISVSLYVSLSVSFTISFYIFSLFHSISRSLTTEPKRSRGRYPVVDFVLEGGGADVD